MVSREDIERMVRAHLMEKGVQTGAASGRHYIVAANWKMNMTRKETCAFINDMKKVRIPGNEKVIVFPPYPYLSDFRDMLRYDHIVYGAQDCAKEEKGAYTGEVSAAMIADMGCTYALVGHSERRSYYSDTPEIVGKKAKAALGHMLIPMICIGETLQERNANLYRQVLKMQLDAVYAELGADIAKTVIAYEPVWAIGTGVIPTMEQIAETQKYIHDLLASYKGCETSVPEILYGGSVNEKNVRDIASVEYVGGFLIGGAGLKSESFTNIINAVAE